MKRRLKKGFSLIEMVIVILILGIIAAVAAPRMFETASTAEENTTRQQLAVLRNAIEMHRAQNGSYPSDLPTAMAAMLNGPFPAPTIDPVRGLAGVLIDSNTDPDLPAAPVTDTTNGWVYKPLNGNLRLNIDDSNTLGFDW